jgi:hypothetical protein
MADFCPDPIGKQRIVERIRELKRRASVKFSSVCLTMAHRKKTTACTGELVALLTTSPAGRRRIEGVNRLLFCATNQ